MNARFLYPMLALMVAIASSASAEESEKRDDFFDKEELNKGFFSEDQSPTVARGKAKFRPGRDSKKIFTDPAEFMREHPDFYIPDVSKIKAPTPSPEMEREDSYDKRNEKEKDEAKSDGQEAF